jgi:hypothetical protein
MRNERGLESCPTCGGSGRASLDIEELLKAFDVLYKYASDEGCPNKERHKFSRPNQARAVVESWLESTGATKTEA